ncbi:DUF389 domain-containing protein [Roseomonas aeriglobus]|nr:DUF389 domain-containing protein [Roseomonas aeriglobus]
MAYFSKARVVTRWWNSRVIGTVDRVEVLDRVHDDAGWTGRYLFMVAMSAGIAVLGLLLSSPAVVIGAMLISPLMGPIIGLGFALATVDSRYIRRSAVALVAGSVVAVLFCALIALASPLQNITSEIAARTRPNLFDLLVAIFSALAGTYATIRGRAGTIVGVAIATALMPPLATVGFGLATGNLVVLGGALLLFVTNFVAIALTAAVMARLYGFASALSPRQNLLQSVAIIATFVGLSIPLGLSLRGIAWENLATRQARAAVGDAFPDTARISQLDIDFAQTPVRVNATVLTPAYRARADAQASAQLSRLIGRPARIAIIQYHVSVGDAAAAELQKANRSVPQPATDPAVGKIVDALSVAGGVDRNSILIDADRQIASARAAALSGATIATYRALEARAAAAAPNWQVHLIPPALPLPTPEFADATPDVADILWAARRRGDAVEVSGAQSAAIVTALSAGGVVATQGAASGPTRLAWAAPVSTP